MANGLSWDRRIRLARGESGLWGLDDEVRAARDAAGGDEVAVALQLAVLAGDDDERGE